ncbi:MAG TPA: response regulator [Caldilineaceae bacterium]|nr:response regulator [Caldilineaceae bacterium]
MKRTAHLLVVDADPLFACKLQVSLQEAGYNVYMARDAQEATATAQRAPIDLILVDARVVEAAGLGLGPALRKQRDVPIMVLSASKLPEDMIIAFLAGADDYIAKPFSLREVKGRIQKLLEGAAPIWHETHETRVGFDQGEPRGQENSYPTR